MALAPSVIAITQPSQRCYFATCAACTAGQTPYITGIEIQLRQQDIGDLYGVGVLLIARIHNLQTGNHIRRQWPNPTRSNTPTPTTIESQLENPVGHWNHAEITCTPDLIPVWLNTI